jgi:hypothetical protein
MSAIYSVIKNNVTKDYFVADSWQIRYWRMRKRVLHWAELAKKLHADMVMVRLSYVGLSEDWRPRDISHFVKACHKRYGSRLLGYAWVGELQARGSVHYHVLLLLGPGTTYVHPDESGDWSLGSTRIEPARSAFYIVSYVGKEYQKNYDLFPKGMRCFAVWFADKNLAKELSDACKSWCKRTLEKLSDNLAIEIGSAQRAKYYFCGSTRAFEDALAWVEWKKERGKEDVYYCSGYEKSSRTWKGAQNGKT